jgi:glutamine synthetase
LTQIPVEWYNDPVDKPIFCPNPNCSQYKAVGQDNIVKFGEYASKQGPRSRYLCKACGKTFSERSFSDLYGLHADEGKIGKFLEEFQGGKSLRRISREMGIKLDTARSWRDKFKDRRNFKMDDASKEVIERAKSDEVKFINLQFTDIMGSIKSVAIPVQRLKDVLEKGIWFDGSSIEGFVRICESDMILRPDPLTYQVTPWTPSEHKSARFICDVYTPEGAPFEGDPRSILKRALAEADRLGYVYNCGPEVEFYLFKREDGRITTSPHDIGGYFDYSPRDMASNVRKDIIIALETMGMVAEMGHHECGPGQHEIDIRFADALTAADNTITLKYTIKAVAQRHDLYASFMPKPLYGQAGSGMHVHQSIFDKKGKNLFFDPKDKYKFSKLAYHFLAGQLEHAKALAAVVAPTINSYKRLVSGYEAPVYICWAQINRSALIRIPRYSPGREQSTRMELRCPDPSCNPYLAFAAMLGAGLDGIKRELQPPKPVEEDVYKLEATRLEELGIDMLPFSIKRAVEELRKDKVVQEALGKHTFEKFTEAKLAEFDDYRMQITPWEIEKYLEAL